VTHIDANRRHHRQSKIAVIAPITRGVKPLQRVLDPRIETTVWPVALCRS
jgi:hypothetical protein